MICSPGIIRKIRRSPERPTAARHRAAWVKAPQGSFRDAVSQTAASPRLLRSVLRVSGPGLRHPILPMRSEQNPSRESRKQAVLCCSPVSSPRGLLGLRGEDLSWSFLPLAKRQAPLDLRPAPPPVD